MFTQQQSDRSAGLRAVFMRLAVFATLVVVVPAVVMAAPTDTQIADAVEDEYMFDRAVPYDAVDVSVTDGVVDLSGEVNNILARDRATRLAETVKGVRSVVNRIKVDPALSRSDTAIQGDIQAAMLSDPATDSYEVTAMVENGIATLTGSVESWTERDLAGKVAKGVRGVRGLINDITVEHDRDRPDSEIKPEIEQALRWDTLVDDSLIDVRVDDGQVTLSGTVGSAAEKREARYQSWVAGVKSVDTSDVDVERWARDEDLRLDKYKSKSPAAIENAVNDAMLYDPRVLSFNIEPEVTGSTVVLRGVVDNLKAKRAAAQVARSTVGVASVLNRLKVRPADEWSDAEIAQSIRDGLKRDPHVERFEIVVSVDDQIATLFGTVDSYFEKWQADDVASRTNGVIDVTNNLKVDDADPIVYNPYVFNDYPYDYDWYDYEPQRTFLTDLQIERDIEDELMWSPYVDSDEVTVVVDDGEATLTGTVDSWSEFYAASKNAYEGGAIWVDNELNVKTTATDS